MPKFDDKTIVSWNVHLNSSVSKVYEYIATDAGRRLWWSSKSDEKDGYLNLSFGRFRILRKIPDKEFSFNYLDDTTARFLLTACESGGTDLNITETGISSEDHWLQNYPGWVEVLLVLKGAVDFGIDLRHGKNGKTWEDDFVDV